MATKKKAKAKSSGKKKALKEYIELGAEFAVNKAQIEELTRRNNELAPEIRKLAKKAGLDKVKGATDVTPDLALETRFTTREIYDEERLQKWLKKKKLTKVLKACFTTKEVTTFDRAAFEKLDEAGKIPDVEELEEGEDPIYKVEPQTPSLYLHPSNAAKEAAEAAKNKKKRKGKK